MHVIATRAESSLCSWRKHCRLCTYNERKKEREKEKDKKHIVSLTTPKIQPIPLDRIKHLNQAYMGFSMLLKVPHTSITLFKDLLQIQNATMIRVRFLLLIS